jgi:hypothetical protein
MVDNVNGLGQLPAGQHALLSAPFCVHSVRRHEFHQKMVPSRCRRRDRRTFEAARAGAAGRARSCSIPPCGRRYPTGLRGALAMPLRSARSEDCYVDELFGAAPSRLGAPLLVAISRAPFSTSTASPMSSIRACSTAGAALRQYALDAGRRAGSARAANRGEAHEIYFGRCRSRKRSRGSSALQALSRRRCAADPARMCASVTCRPDRLPFDAGERGSAATGSRPISSSAIASAPALGRCSVVDIGPRRPSGGHGLIACRRAIKPYAGGFITEHYGRPTRKRARAADRDQPRALYGRGRRWCGAPKHKSAEMPKNARFCGSFGFLRHVLRESGARPLSHLPNGAIFTDFIAEDFFFKKMCHKHKQPFISRSS